MALVLSLMSCSKDEVNTFEYYPEPSKEVIQPENVDIIVGTWKHKNGNLQIFTNLGEYVIVKFEEEYHYRGGTWEKTGENSYLLKWEDLSGFHEVPFTLVDYETNQMILNIDEEEIKVNRY